MKLKLQKEGCLCSTQLFFNCHMFQSTSDLNAAEDKN